jgi:hypothetical protein
LSNNPQVIALLLSVSLLSGCNGTSGSGIQEATMQSNGQPANTTTVQTAKAENPTPATGNAVRIARWWPYPKGGRLAAAGRGTLSVVNNCLVISYKGYPPTLPIFPYDSGVWDGAKQTFTYQGKVIRIGETIEFGGGKIELDILKENGIKYDVPDCGITDLWLAN